MEYQRLLTQTEQFVRQYYEQHGNPKYAYHNIEHIINVVNHAVLISDHYKLNERDWFIILAATWMHDLGYMTDMDNHEEAGAIIAAEFLQRHRLDSEDIDAVKCCILATRVPQKPALLLEQIVCDADLYDLGTEFFFDNDKLLRKERQLLYKKKINKAEWQRQTVSFMESHQYHTEYCQSLLNPTKRQNLDKCKQKLDKTRNGTVEKKTGQPVRGVETMFKVSSGIHQRLSYMADNKAHIMITVNSIILSAIISLMLRKIGEYPYLILPSFILLSISLLTMTFAILATRPTLSRGTFTPADLADKRVNLIFFGNFYKMSFDQYDSGMKVMMADRDFLYGTLRKDIYTQGVILGKKYHLLRLAYNTFMYGLIVSVLAFVIASFTHLL